MSRLSTALLVSGKTRLLLRFGLPSSWRREWARISANHPDRVRRAVCIFTAETVAPRLSEPALDVASAGVLICCKLDLTCLPFFLSRPYPGPRSSSRRRRILVRALTWAITGTASGDEGAMPPRISRKVLRFSANNGDVSFSLCVIIHTRSRLSKRLAALSSFSSMSDHVVMSCNAWKCYVTVSCLNSGHCGPFQGERARLSSSRLPALRAVGRNPQTTGLKCRRISCVPYETLCCSCRCPGRMVARRPHTTLAK